MHVKGLALGLTAIFGATGAQAATVFAVDELNNLITFNSANPSLVTSSVAITGLSNSIQSLDFRPFNNALYGLGTDRIVYTINTNTGAATAVSSVLALTGTEFGFDFNPTIDRLRIVTNTNDNYVYNPVTNTLAPPATPVFYGAGDPNAGRDPDVTAVAYTSAAFGAPGSSTQLYSVDTAGNFLVKQANSAGTLTTVGALGTDVGSRTSFDIRGLDAFVANGRRFYSVDLATGTLTQIGLADRALFGIAIAAPEPATWGLMILGFGGIAGAMRRRSTRMTVRYA